MEFRLNRYMKASYRLPAYEVDAKGHRTRVEITFSPDKVYDTADFPNILNLEGLVNTTVSYIRYKKETLAELKRMEAPYSLHGCQSCGGGFKQIKLMVFEVVQ